MPERDFIRETAESNAHVLLVRMVEDDAEKAIDSRDIEELIAILRDAVRRCVAPVGRIGGYVGSTYSTLGRLQEVISGLIAWKAQGATGNIASDLIVAANSFTSLLIGGLVGAYVQR
jgi:hypothetical protein